LYSSVTDPEYRRSPRDTASPDKTFFYETEPRDHAGDASLTGDVTFPDRNAASPDGDTAYPRFAFPDNKSF